LTAKETVVAGVATTMLGMIPGWRLIRGALGVESGGQSKRELDVPCLVSVLLLTLAAAYVGSKRISS